MQHLFQDFQTRNVSDSILFHLQLLNLFFINSFSHKRLFVCFRMNKAVLKEVVEWKPCSLWVFSLSKFILSSWHTYCYVLGGHDNTQSKNKKATWLQLVPKFPYSQGPFTKVASYKWTIESCHFIDGPDERGKRRALLPPSSSSSSTHSFKFSITFYERAPSHKSAQGSI